MFDDCCKTGFKWDGQPLGHEGVLGNNKTYITGDNKDTAVLLVHDLFGWTFDNLRILADYFAQKANCTCYIPDFYAGEVIPHDTLTEAFLSPSKMKLLDLPAFNSRHGKDIRYPEILSCAKILKSQYSKIGVVGYCWGGWACFRLAGEENLFDCMAVAHPSLLEKKEIDVVKVPTLIIAPEFDPAFTKELRDYCNEVLPGKGIDYRLDWYSGLAHGFSVKGDREDEKQRVGLEKAKRSVVSWFNEWLH